MASATFLMPGSNTIADLVYNNVREFDRKGGRFELRACGDNGAVIAWLIVPPGRDDDFAVEMAVFNRYHRELVRQLENFGTMDCISDRAQ